MLQVLSVERFRLCAFRPVICVGTGLGPLVWTRHSNKGIRRQDVVPLWTWERRRLSTGMYPPAVGKPRNRRISLEKSSNYGGLSLDCPCLLRELINIKPNPI